MNYFLVSPSHRPRVPPPPPPRVPGPHSKSACPAISHPDRISPQPRKACRYPANSLSTCQLTLSDVEGSFWSRRHGPCRESSAPRREGAVENPTSSFFLTPQLIPQSRARHEHMSRLLVEERIMKRIEMSDVASNLLVVSSVMLAITPFMLGDRLTLIASSMFREGAIMLNKMSPYLTKLLS